jgi:hypothetical protein
MKVARLTVLAALVQALLAAPVAVEAQQASHAVGISLWGPRATLGTSSQASVPFPSIGCPSGQPDRPAVRAARSGPR